MSKLSHCFLILYGLIAAVISFTACGGGGREAQPQQGASIPPQPEENVALSGPAELTQAGQSYEIEVSSFEKEITPPFVITLEDIDPELATFEFSGIAGGEPATDMVVEDKRVVFKEMPKLPLIIRFELTLSKNAEENREITPAFRVHDAVTKALLMAKELPTIRTAGPKVKKERELFGDQIEAAVNIFEPTDFNLSVSPKGAQTGPVIWSSSIAGVDLTPKSGGGVQVLSRVCRPFLLQALTFDAETGPSNPKISAIHISTICGSVLTPRLSFKKHVDGAPAGNIKITFSIPNGQMAVKGLLGTFLEEEIFTTNVPYLTEPPFTLDTENFGFSNFGRLDGLQLILFSHACPVNKDCILRIEMRDELSEEIPNIELAEAGDLSSNGTPVNYLFSTTDDQGVRRTDIVIPNPLLSE
jgi:hypothetical protein